jgi:hypothetical protein
MKQRSTPLLDAGADLRADGHSVASAANALGIKYPMANLALERIRKRLGSQAV